MSDIELAGNNLVRGRAGTRADEHRNGGLLEGKTTNGVISAFYEVYDYLGYGLSEVLYSDALELELRGRGYVVHREYPAPVFYKMIHLRTYRLDILVNRKIILEIKAGEVLQKGALRQLTNYLNVTEFEVGLLLHFGLEPKFYRRVCSNNH